MDDSVKRIVEQLDMLPHPEGGFYKENYRSIGSIPKESMSEGFSGDRSYSTAIYFLLTSDNFSAFHRIKQDEIWHFYGGSPLYVHTIDGTGEYRRYTVGMELSQGESPQLVVPAGCWFASNVKEQNSYSLVGCTVAPGFDFDDFELADKNKLIQRYPEHSVIIDELTR